MDRLSTATSQPEDPKHNVLRYHLPISPTLNLSSYFLHSTTVGFRKPSRLSIRSLNSWSCLPSLYPVTSTHCPSKCSTWVLSFAACKPPATAYSRTDLGDLTCTPQVSQQKPTPKQVGPSGGRKHLFSNHLYPSSARRNNFRSLNLISH